jgi:signal transduction histidine kinase
LPSGHYEFEVTAGNEAGVWNQTGFNLSFDVRPFVWQTWWFRALLVMTFTTAVIAMVRYVSFRRLRARMRLLEQQAVLDKERARIAKDLHDDLGASMTQMTLMLELALQQRLKTSASSCEPACSSPSAIRRRTQKSCSPPTRFWNSSETEHGSPR